MASAEMIRSQKAPRTSSLPRWGWLFRWSRRRMMPLGAPASETLRCLYATVTGGVCFEWPSLCQKVEVNALAQLE